MAFVALSRGLLRDGFRRFSSSGHFMRTQISCSCTRTRDPSVPQVRDGYGGGSKEPKCWSSTCALRASSIFGDFHVYGEYSVEVLEETMAYKTDVCILPKLLDEKVASLHLPVLGAALTASHSSTRFLGFQIEGPVSSVRKENRQLLRIGRLLIVCCPLQGGRFPVQFASLAPFVCETKSEDVTHEEYAHSSYNSLSHDCDIRSESWRAGKSTTPSLGRSVSSTPKSRRDRAGFTVC